MKHIRLTQNTTTILVNPERITAVYPADKGALVEFGIAFSETPVVHVDESVSEIEALITGPSAPDQIVAPFAWRIDEDGVPYVYLMSGLFPSVSLRIGKLWGGEFVVLLCAGDDIHHVSPKLKTIEEGKKYAYDYWSEIVHKNWLQSKKSV